MDFQLGPDELAFEAELEKFLSEHHSDAVMDANSEQLSQTVDSPEKRAFMAQLAEGHAFYGEYGDNALAWYHRTARRCLYVNHVLIDPPIDRHLPRMDVRDLYVSVDRDDDPHGYMWRAILRSRFVEDLGDRPTVIEAARAHNDAVIATVPPERLLVWSPGDGWEPICRALDLPVPDVPFPHSNSRQQFIARREAAES